MTAPAVRQQRIVGVDACRSVAILLAMFSHCLVKFDFFELRDEAAWASLRFVTQMAPPVFIILFGSMLEIVYRPRLAAGDVMGVSKRLMTRALQCYLLYVATLVALFAFTDTSFAYTVRCALLLGVTPYADILKFYAIVLALAPALIWLRERIGLVGLTGLTLAIHATHPLIAAAPVPPDVFGKDYFGPFVKFLYNGGDAEIGGPSILHGITFVMWGMIVGRAAVLTLAPATARKGVAILAAMFAVAASVVITHWEWAAPVDTLLRISDMSLRNDNRLIYFALGLASTIAAAALCLLLFDILKLSFARSILFLGKTSLFTFSFGNILLYAVPRGLGADLLFSVIYPLVFIALICLQSFAFLKLQSSRFDTQTRLGGALHRAQDMIAQLTRGVAELAALPARIYGAALDVKRRDDGVSA